MSRIAPLKKYLPLISTCVLFFLVLSFWIFFPSFSNTTSVNEWDGSIADSFSGGNGSIDNPYIIDGGSQLAYLKLLLESEEEASLYLDKHYKLSNDIHLGNFDFYIENKESFAGSLDGDGYTISHGKITNSLFTSLEEATIKNINFKSITVENTEEIVSALISSTSINSLFENVTAAITFEVKADNFVGTFLGTDEGSVLKNVVINTDYEINGGLENKIASVLYNGTDTKLEMVLVKSNEFDLFIENANIVEEEVIYYTVDNFDVVIDGKDTSKLLKSLIDSETYLFKVENGKIVFARKEVPVKMSSGFSISSIPSVQFVLNNSGIVGNTLYINDLEADWNYYSGLNYTMSTNGSLPSGVDQNIYNKYNLVRVQLSYSATDPIGNLTGSVSITEPQNKYVYYKYYPVVNSKINIELIDNPFVNRPNNKAFNNWVVDGSGKISVDYTVYKRYLEVDVTYTNGVPDDIAIDLHASWVDATVVNVTATPNWANIFTALNAQTMMEIPFKSFTCSSLTGQQLYTEGWVAQGSRYGSNNGSVRNPNGSTVNNNTSCNTAGGCTYYTLVTGNYVEGTIYYQFINNSFTVVDLVTLGICTTTPLNTQYNGKSMAGLFTGSTLAIGTPLAGYYDASGNLLTSGTVSSASTVYYTLLQGYDSFGNQPIYDVNNRYFYFVTRDTNIVVLRSNASTTWTSANQNSKPFTLTMAYNGTDYRNNFAWTVSSINIQTYADTVIEYLRTTNSVNNNGTSPTSNTSASYVYGNHLNLKIGRGMIGTGNRTFGGVFGGGSSNLGSTSAYRRYSLIVESGNFNNIVITEGTGTAYINQAMTITGNDYDRITGNNTNLGVSYAAYGVTGGTINSSASNNKAIYHNVRSGSFGTSLTDAYTGIYTGGRGGTLNMESTIKVDGGWINLINGGPGSGTNRRNINHIFINVTGGEVGNIYGGAGSSDAQGNRIVNVTGGKINYSVFGGSNSSSGSTGYMAGSSLVYIGGNAQIGDATLVDNNTMSQFNNEAGSVFGIGNGASGQSLNGTMVNSNVIIDGNALVLRNVYGGGNRAILGTVTVANGGSATPETNVDIKGGIINGDVYGGSNQGNTGTTSISGMNATLNVKVSGGHVKGSVYGGSNISGIVYGGSNVQINGGTIDNSIYGGGRGGGTSGTFIRNSANVIVGNNGINTIPTISGNVYGGSALGTVNGTSATSATSGATTTVTVNKGIIQGSVFGGAQGSSTVTPVVHGNVVVNINDGNISQVYGANDAAGVPAGSINVYLDGGTIGSVFGGGNQASANNPQVFLRGATVTTIYGGSNQSGDVNTTNIQLTSGVVANVYGGNNAGGTTTTTNINLNGATVTTIYGGGNLVSAGTTNVNLNSSSDTVISVYGGGRSASVTTANITQNGVSVNTLYGGSNVTGTVINSYINYNIGDVANVYGGNNAGGATITSNISVHSGNISRLFGGGNATGGTNTKVNLLGGEITEVYGGSDNSGDVTNTSITIPQNSNVIVDTLYGGNNAGGITNNANININNGSLETVYGGGNLTETINAVVDISGGTITTLYGGGNSAAILANTRVSIVGGIVRNNVYGGGNLGVVNGNTDVSIIDATIGTNVYGGGNGAAAIVMGNTNVNIGGTTVVGEHNIANNSDEGIFGSVFGGGNAAATGILANNDSTATVNIAGGSINGNVYGGANTSIVYGSTNVNIGINAVKVSGMTADDIYIKGTVFGGGEANAAGSEEYDYSFISVTQGIDIQIDGSGHKQFATNGSFFGSGNASSSQGESTITIKNYGTFAVPQKNISIQRAHTLIIDNSSIMLSGASDRTNEFSDVPFSFSLIDLLKIQNNSNLFLEVGANVLKRVDSLTAGGQLAVVDINDKTKSVSKNVDNRIYILEGKNINIATNENVTSFGEVNGMTFFGMFTYDRDGLPNKGIYDPSFDYGDALDWGLMPAKGSYVLGLHKTNHDITVDGFYSHFMNEDTETNEIAYIEPTPEDANFYMWVVGEAVIEYEIDLVASKYSTLGSAELNFLEFSRPNTTFQVLGFDVGDLKQGISLIDGRTIPRVASTQQEANNVMGLSMRAGISGWLTDGETSFLTTNPDITGTKTYIGDNSTTVPSLVFYLYHSKNLTGDDDLGTVRVTLMATTRIDALTYETQRIVVNVNLSQALYLNNFYEGTMTAGREYEMFASSVVNITSKSSLSTYYSLFIDGDSVYKPGVHRALVSSYVLPVNTKLTMIDLASGTPTYYYYVITQADVLKAEAEHTLYGEASYRLSMFTKMGSVSSSTNYDDEAMNAIYYDSTTGITDEAFIFIVDFDDTTIDVDNFNNTLLIEMRNDTEQTIMSVLGIQHSSLVYNIHANRDAYIDVNAGIGQNPLYIGHRADLSVDTNFVNDRYMGNPVFDTSFFDSKLGLKITLIDYNGDVVSGTSLMGLSFILDGFRYFPSIDGSTRIKIADRVGNITQNFVMDMANATLPTGRYILQIEAFSSPDGIYYGETTSGIATIPITVINELYGLNATIDDNSSIIDAETGFNQKGEAALEYVIDYHSGLENPNIRLQMFRREYTSTFSTDFELVDLQDYISANLSSTSNEKEYLILSDPEQNNSLILLLKSNLLTGTYRLDFNLYDGNVFIGRVSRYIIIK